MSSFEEIKGNIPLGQAIIPNKERSVICKEIYERYEQLAKDLSKYLDQKVGEPNAGGYFGTGSKRNVEYSRGKGTISYI
ncbi:hypothetical protein ACFQDF_32710 [Ectobacillus funiculus]